MVGQALVFLAYADSILIKSYLYFLCLSHLYVFFWRVLVQVHNSHSSTGYTAAKGESMEISKNCTPLQPKKAVAVDEVHPASKILCTKNDQGVRKEGHLERSIDNSLQGKQHDNLSNTAFCRYLLYAICRPWTG